LGLLVGNDIFSKYLYLKFYFLLGPQGVQGEVGPQGKQGIQGPQVILIQFIDVY
jgi:hypothetical protein